MSRKRRSLVAGATVAIVGAGLLAAFVVTSTSPGSKFDATDSFSVFRDTPATNAPADLTRSASLSKADFARTHEPGKALGRYESRLLIFPSNGDQNICYALLGTASDDPAASYCYSPKDPAAPAGLGDEHFSVMPLQSLTSDGQKEMQVFGVAFDDVTRVRLQVAGQWRSIPIVHNGFYVDLPGVSLDQLGQFEATLRGGTRQLHNMQTSSSVPSS